MNYTLFVGLERDADKNPLQPWEISDFTVDVEKDTAKTFGGYSAIPVYGGWVNPDQVLVREKSLRIEVNATDIPREKVLDWAKYVKFKFRQASVLLVESESIGTFV